jgi:hypothetical protein
MIVLPKEIQHTVHPHDSIKQVNLPRTAAALAFVGLAGTVAAVTDHASPRGDAASAAVLCGGSNRWDVKTLSDLRGPNAPKINPKIKRNAERRTIHYLVTQEHEAIGKHTARLAGVERTKYVLTNVVLVEAKVEGDQDVHLVIRDEHGKPSDHMIVEFPNGRVHRDCADAERERHCAGACRRR